VADNTILPVGSGGDNIRDIDRSGSGPKTQVVQLDFGGVGATEQLASGANPLAVVDSNSRAAWQAKLLSLNQFVSINQFGNGFFPAEVPSIGA
jgi:hypothetical protein